MTRHPRIVVGGASLIAIGILIGLTAEPVSAQGLLGDILNRDPSQFTKNDITRVIVRLIQFALGFVAAVGALSIFVNGYQYILAAGNPEKLEKAKMGLTWSIGGFVLAVSAFAIVFIFQRALRAEQPITDVAPGGLGAPLEGATILERMFSLLVVFAGAAAIIFLLLGGYRYMTSRGNEEQVEKAKKTILYSVIGLLLIFSAVIIYIGLSETFGRSNPL